MIEAKCVQCHQSTPNAFARAIDTAVDVASSKSDLSKNIETALKNEESALVELLKIKNGIQSQGVSKVVANLEKRIQDFALPQSQRKVLASQLEYLREVSGISQGVSIPDTQNIEKKLIDAFDEQIIQMVGTASLAQKLEQSTKKNSENIPDIVQNFISAHQNDPNASGSLFAKIRYIDFEKETLQHAKNMESSLTSALQNQKNISSIQTEIDFLTKDYHRGQNLYISQACYACHRIAGFARGGVGPELTEEGKTAYPWYIKQKIHWPQGDLKTSTMPNFRLDHAELEPIVGYVLGQKGKSNAISETEYKSQIDKWETGSKMPWEKPITPTQMLDLRYSMTVFATEGCAACHRLKGFESDVGYKVEKGHQDKIDFETLYKEREWFNRLFPEDISGSDLVKALEAHANEVDEHIVDHVRSGSILEEINQKVPETIEAYYNNFRYASRAKNDEYTQQAAKETNPAKKHEILEKLDLWKQRMHRVLMVYVQEYGLGRLIGPRPNWSGIYRSDEWLMEHFHNPTSRVPRSIMPVFPFDDTKFYALTHMLDVLGKQNRDEVREIWKHHGFNPSQAFQIYCSQCHGAQLQGNGPVAEWIFPIPKNLTNSNFLLNLTRPRVLDSITHGIKGTPMPPWGEAAMDKPTADGIPVLNKEEIYKLAEWLYSNIPGGRGIQNVPKWEYKPENVIEELRNERKKLPSAPANKTWEGELKSNLGYLYKGEGLFAALSPYVYPSNLDQFKPDESGFPGAEIFNRIPNPEPGFDKYLYYIKQIYYTPENIAQGKTFFEMNCAVCHGQEADGSGPRAEVMQEAKPRDLIDIDWQGTHDDMFLLRSIKFGLPGTAMIPWGDQTNSLQRLQLVLFIRSLTESTILERELMGVLFKSFSYGDMFIEDARKKEYSSIDVLNKEYLAAQTKQKNLADQAAQGVISVQEATEGYQKLLKLTADLQKHEQIDGLLVDLKTELDNEKTIFRQLGTTFIEKQLPQNLYESFFKIISLEENTYHLNDGKLVLAKETKNKKEEAAKLEKEIIDVLNRQINDLKQKKVITEGKIYSSMQMQEINVLESEIKNLTDLRNQTVASFYEILRSRQKQLTIYDKLQEKMKQIQPSEKK